MLSGYNKLCQYPPIGIPIIYILYIAACCPLLSGYPLAPTLLDLLALVGLLCLFPCHVVLLHPGIYHPEAALDAGRTSDPLSGSLLGHHVGHVHLLGLQKSSLTVDPV